MKMLVLGLALLALGLGAGLSGTAVRAQELQWPTISVEPVSYGFGNVPLNSEASAFIRVNNTGDAPLIVSNVKTKAPIADNAPTLNVPLSGNGVE